MYFHLLPYYFTAALHYERTHSKHMPTFNSLILELSGISHTE